MTAFLFLDNYWFVPATMLVILVLAMEVPRWFSAALSRLERSR